MRFVTTKANALIIGDGDPIIRVLNVTEVREWSADAGPNADAPLR